MKHEWYGDKRDVVKWGVLAHLAKTLKTPRIIQVAMLTGGESSDDNTLHCKALGNAHGCSSTKIEDAVIHHFRKRLQLDSIRRIGIPIKVHKSEYNCSKADRKKYFKDLLDKLKKGKQPFIMLLDPDTGIKPKNGTNRHLWPEDLSKCWDSLSDGSWLVVYQHRPQRKPKTGD